MNDLMVVMPATSVRGLLPTYLSQLNEAEIAYHIEKIEDFKTFDSIGAAFSLIRGVLEKFPDVKTFIFTDAFDVLFYGTKEEVLSKIPQFKVLLGAERNCYPDITLTDKIQGKPPWKFANGGLVAGHRESIERWMSAIECTPHYRKEMCNQTYYNLSLFLSGRIPNAVLDYETNMFYCMFQEKGELGFDKGLPVNKVHGTTPNFIHFNGQWPSMPTLELRDNSLGIVKPEQKLAKVIVSVPVSIEVCEDCRNRILKEMMP